MKVAGLCGGMMRGSGRGRRLNLDFPSSSSPGSFSTSWREEALFNLIFFFGLRSEVFQVEDSAAKHNRRGPANRNYKKLPHT